MSRNQKRPRGESGISSIEVILPRSTIASSNERVWAAKGVRGLYPYAPTLHPADYNHGEEYVFVTFDRVATSDQYAQKWKELRDLN
jgi:hypothetical protein